MKSTLWRNNNYASCQKQAVLYYCIHWYITSLLFCLFISLATPRSTDCWAKSRPGHRSSSALEAGFVEVAAVGCPLLVGPSGFIQRSTDGRGAKVKKSEVSASLWLDSEVRIPQDLPREEVPTGTSKLVAGLLGVYGSKWGTVKIPFEVGLNGFVQILGMFRSLYRHSQF